MNSLEIKRLERALTPHKIQRPENETPAELLSRDLAAIKDFVHYVEAEPFIITEKAENFKRPAFKKAYAV